VNSKNNKKSSHSTTLSNYDSINPYLQAFSQKNHKNSILLTNKDTRLNKGTKHSLTSKKYLVFVILSSIIVDNPNHFRSLWSRVYWIACRVLNYIRIDISMSIDRKTILSEEWKKTITKPIVTDNGTFDLKQIEDFYNLFNLYADNRRQADVR